LNSETDREECEEMLKQFALDKLRENKKIPIMKWVNKTDDKFTRSLVPKISVIEKVLPILGWVREMGDDDFSKQAAACLMDEMTITNSDRILPNDIPNINHILRARDSMLKLILNRPAFVGFNCSQYFYQELRSTLDEHHNIQVRYTSTLFLYEQETHFCSCKIFAHVKGTRLNAHAKFKNKLRAIPASTKEGLKFLIQKQIFAVKGEQEVI